MPDRRRVCGGTAALLLFACTKETARPTTPIMGRSWRGRTRRDRADEYGAVDRREGIPPLEETALGFQLLREDREEESWFTFMSDWRDRDAMRPFTGSQPTKVHLPRRHDRD